MEVGAQRSAGRAHAMLSQSHRGCNCFKWKEQALLPWIALVKVLARTDGVEVPLADAGITGGASRPHPSGHTFWPARPARAAPLLPLNKYAGPLSTRQHGEGPLQPDSAHPGTMHHHVKKEERARLAASPERQLEPIVQGGRSVGMWARLVPRAAGPGSPGLAACHGMKPPLS